MNAMTLSAGMTLPDLTIEPVSRKTLALFAGASGDHQPTHIDIDAARAKGRDDVIAHGMLMMAYMSRMLTALVPQQQVKSFKARFVAMTPVHARPVCKGRVVSVNGNEAELDMHIELGDGSIVVRGTAIIRLA